MISGNEKTMSTKKLLLLLVTLAILFNTAIFCNYHKSGWSLKSFLRKTQKSRLQHSSFTHKKWQFFTVFRRQKFSQMAPREPMKPTNDPKEPIAMRSTAGNIGSCDIRSSWLLSSRAEIPIIIAVRPATCNKQYCCIRQSVNINIKQPQHHSMHNLVGLKNQNNHKLSIT